MLWIGLLLFVFELAIIFGGVAEYAADKRRQAVEPVDPLLPYTQEEIDHWRRRTENAPRLT